MVGSYRPGAVNQNGEKMKSQLPATVVVSIPEPIYTLFNSKRAGMAEVIVVNEALLSFVHAEIFPWFLCVTLEARELVEDGMPAPSESELLFQIGDEIEGIVLGNPTESGAKNALFLSRSTWNGLRQLLFYVHDPEITHLALQSLLESRSWERAWDYRMEDDSLWEKATYVFHLFPRAGVVHS